MPITGVTWIDSLIAAFAKLDTVRDGDTLVGAFLGPNVVDFTVGGETEVGPSRPGFYFNALQYRVLVTEIAGTLSTPATFKIGNNANQDNYQLSQSVVPSVIEFNAALAAGLPYVTGPYTASRGRLVDAETPASINITSPQAGTGLTFKGRILWTGYWIPV